MRTRLTGLLAAFSMASLLAASSASAAQFLYEFTMNGPSENPPNASPGTGTGTALYDDVAHTLALTASFSGLQGTVTQTHFHGVTLTSGLPDNNPVGETADQAAAAVVNASIAVGNPSLLNFPLGGTSGAYNQVLDLTLASTYNNSFLSNNGGTPAGAEAAFAGALASGRTYWNIHSSSFLPGEIRGFPVLVPEPATAGLASLAFAAMVIRRRRK